jgi:hypothetical protein
MNNVAAGSFEVIPARAPYRTGLAERVPNYRAAISAAKVAAWNDTSP